MYVVIQHTKDNIGEWISGIYGPFSCTTQANFFVEKQSDRWSGSVRYNVRKLIDGGEKDLEIREIIS